MGSLRFLLAITVLLAHGFGGGLISGRFAVECFFIISGYLISFVYTESKSYDSIWKFYINRALRILPLYYLVILISFPAYLIAHLGFNENNQFSALGQMPLGIIFMIGILNLLIIGQEQLFFLSLHENSLDWTGNFLNTDVELYRGLIVPQSWTLSIEILFYAIAPFILYRRKAICFLLIASAGLRILFFLKEFGLSDPWVYRFFPTELMFFLVGALMHQLWSPITLKMNSRFYSFCKWVAIILLPVYFVTFPFWKSNFILRNFFLFFLVSAVLPFYFKIQNENRVDNFLGQLSFPIYIWHLLVIVFVGGLSEKIGLPDLVRISLIISATLAVSWLSLIILDSRVQKIRHAFRSRSI
jgi:peptidoglycan/LPS O-acetylase OafA/YrhL